MIRRFLSHIGSPFVPELVEEFVQGSGSIQNFVQWAPSIDSIQAYAATRHFSAEKRATLVDTLTRQYTAINGSKQVVLDNIAALRDAHTFTITTGQQIHAFLGPVFFVTKILDCIALAEQATAQATDKKFVPVFWMAAEDHDFAEIDTVSVYNTPFTWTTDGTGGPVGRLSPQSLDSMVQALRERLDKTELHDKYLDIFTYAYAHFSTLATATHYILDALFGDKGLVIINGDDLALKQLFVPILAADIFDQISYPAIVQQTDALLATGFKKQAHPREINVFFMTDTHRGRIIQEGEEYIVDGTSQRFSASALRDTLEQDPASFSPNVFLRPLYQETILPNVAYIPGPAEFNYRLQMKQLFAVHKLVMPVVIPRTLTQFLSSKNYEKITTGPIPLDDYFLPYGAFLDVITHIDADALSDTQSVINTLQDTVSTLQEKLTQKHISHKKITKSLTVLSQEIHTLSQSVDQATKTTIEESESYAPYIKLYKNFFDVEQRFERNNYVVGQLSVIDQMLHMDSLSYEAGKVLLYIYD